MLKRNSEIQLPPASNGDALFDEPQAADYLHQKPRTLRLWRRTRGLPHLKVTSRVVLYRRSDLDAWLNRSRTVIAS